MHRRLMLSIAMLALGAGLLDRDGYGRLVGVERA